MKYARLLVLYALSVSLLFSACKKDSDSHPAPVTMPLSVAAAKAGDTIRIHGTNFNEDVNQVKVSFNGTAGTVVSASATEIVVVVPQGATSGNVTVTVFENTVNAGTLTINVLTLYGIRETEQSGGPTTKEFVTIDPATLTVSVLQDLTALLNDNNLSSLVYLPATNELAGIGGKGLTLTKINMATKQTTSLSLGSDADTYFTDLVSDKTGNLYAIYHKKVYSVYTEDKFMKIDLATGATTSLNAVTGMFDNLSYIPATNELISIAGGYLLLKLNLNTKDTSTVQIAGSGNYKHLTVDDKSNVYCYKTTGGLPYPGSIVKLNAVTGQEIPLSEQFTSDMIWDQMIFVPQLNEIVAIWQNASLYRLNVSSKAQTVKEISSDPNVHFYHLFTN